MAIYVSLTGTTVTTCVSSVNNGSFGIDKG